MKYSLKQLEVFRWFEDSTRGNAVLMSVAGSGKTTTIIESLNFIDDEWPITLVSFTNVIADELKERVALAKFTNVTVSTLNSLGNSLCRKNLPRYVINKFKTSDILRYTLQQLDCDADAIYRLINRPICTMVSLLKSGVIEIEDVEHVYEEIMQHYEVELPEGTSANHILARRIFPMVLSGVYKVSVNTLFELDLDDQKFQPVYRKWAPARNPKFCIVDEAQDCTVCDAQLIRLLGAERNLFVGDQHQCIYGFRGGTNNMMDTLQEMFEAERLQLNVCWRCPDKVIALAKEICPAIEGPVPNPRGEGIVETITTQRFLDEVVIGDFVLCRTTAPLVKRCLQLIRKGTLARVRGKDVGKSLTDLITLICNRTKSKDLAEIILGTQDYLREQLEIFDRTGKEDLASLVSDKCEALLAFCDDATTLEEVKSKIEELFVKDPERGAVNMMTGHKAKGLQNKRVFVLRPDQMPHPRTKSVHGKVQEANLKYVILTRAESELYIVTKEKDEK